MSDKETTPEKLIRMAEYFKSNGGLMSNAVKIANGSAIIEGNKKMPKKHQTEIFEYIRRRKGNKTMKVGVILGIVKDGVIKIGWSKCRVSEDKFTPEDGLRFARARALGETCVNTPVPSCIRRSVRQFGARAVRYFKDATKLELPV